MAIRPDWLQNPLERLESSRDDALGYQGGGGSNYGSPPYKESALKSALRLLAAGARGASYGMQAPDGFGAFGGSFGREYAYKTASERAAQDYALKQQENQRRQEDSEWNRKRDEAYIKQLEKPKKPEKVEPWDLPPDKQAARLDYMRREKIAKTIDKPDRTAILDFNTINDNFRQDKDIQNYTVVRDNARRIEGALGQGTGFGDLSAIFAFMRVLDPNSVVRETEFKNAEEASGFLQRMLNIPGKVVSGNRLTPAARVKIGSMTRQLFNTQKQTYDKKVAQYKKIAKNFGVNESLLIPNYGDDAQTAPGGAADLIYNPATGQLEPAR